jgi:quinoprotein glucose dehydrogenase
MRSRWIAIPIGLALLSALSGQNAKVATQAPAGDWPMFNRDLAGTRFSPLTQINTANVATLTQAWQYPLQPAGFRFATAGGSSELVPIVVNGVMYISGQTRVMALEPETGKEIWRYEIQEGQASQRDGA